MDGLSICREGMKVSIVFDQIQKILLAPSFCVCIVYFPLRGLKRQMLIEATSVAEDTVLRVGIPPY